MHVPLAGWGYILSLTSPLGIRAHSTRAVASSQAFLSGSSMGDICAAAGWSSPSTFVKFYSLDVRTAPGFPLEQMLSLDPSYLRYVRQDCVAFPYGDVTATSKWPMKGNISVTYVTTVPWIGNEMLRFRPFRTFDSISLVHDYAYTFVRRCQALFGQ